MEEEFVTGSDVIDRTKLDELLDMMDGDQEFVAELIHEYIDDAAKQIASMHEALDTGSAEELRRAAHSLKSNSARFGATRLSQTCRDLEEASITIVPDTARDQIAQIVTEYETVRQALQTGYIQEDKPPTAIRADTPLSDPL